MVVPYRGDDMEWRHLKVTGDLGRVIPMPYNIRDLDSVKETLRYSDKAINLIGKYYETQHGASPDTRFMMLTFLLQKLPTAAQRNRRQILI